MCSRKFLAEIFKIATPLMTDGDDLVRKGVGWLLKEASKKHPLVIYRFLLKWKGLSPSILMNYAWEKLPQKYKNKLKSKSVKLKVGSYS